MSGRDARGPRKNHGRHRNGALPDHELNKANAAFLGRIHRAEQSRLPRVARIESSFAMREIVNRLVPPSVFNKPPSAKRRRGDGGRAK